MTLNSQFLRAKRKKGKKQAEDDSDFEEVDCFVCLLGGLIADALPERSAGNAKQCATPRKSAGRPKASGSPGSPPRSPLRKSKNGSVFVTDV
jgi:hypothetical protein